MKTQTTPKLAHTLDARSHYCRREDARQKRTTCEVSFWSERIQKPRRVSAIEADARGARLLLPRDVEVGNFIHVSFADELGHYQSYEARVVWSHGLTVSGKQIAGVMFLGETGALTRGLATAGLKSAALPAQTGPSWSRPAA